MKTTNQRHNEHTQLRQNVFIEYFERVFSSCLINYSIPLSEIQSLKSNIYEEISSFFMYRFWYNQMRSKPAPAYFTAISINIAFMLNIIRKYLAEHDQIFLSLSSLAYFSIILFTLLLQYSVLSLFFVVFLFWFYIAKHFTIWRTVFLVVLRYGRSFFYWFNAILCRKNWRNEG